MTAGTAAGTPETFFQRLDRSAFGMVYGAITVLSILLAMGAHPGAPLETAAVLFGSVLAVTLAKAFAELLSHALETGERVTLAAWRRARRHASPTLAAANLPTLFFVAAGLGWMTSDTALWLSQVVCIGLLALLGARVGWVIDRRPLPSVLGGLGAGGVGLALAVMKVVLH